ncbi:two-component system response regulator [Pedobacter sp. SYSU D00535]|uniref:response regulator n=1 Tax=Pedobacter sp. SYSU D00535 TaxID=2810308 RepID=UPI001A97632A|nr:response regulator [Pedobacter sp. SYSU D00535]
MKKRVLILDDDAEVLDVMEEVLTYADYEVKTIESCQELFVMIANFSPDIVLVDYLLNGTTGDEVCRQIKRNSATCHLPVVIVSAYPNLLKIASTCGCNDIISKPFDLSMLLATVEACIHAKNVDL